MFATDCNYMHVQELARDRVNHPTVVVHLPANDLVDEEGAAIGCAVAGRSVGFPIGRNAGVLVGERTAGMDGEEIVGCPGIIAAGPVSISSLRHKQKSNITVGRPEQKEGSIIPASPNASKSPHRMLVGTAMPSGTCLLTEMLAAGTSTIIPGSPTTIPDPHTLQAGNVPASEGGTAGAKLGGNDEALGDAFG